jgi:hypothetical protein
MRTESTRGLYTQLPRQKERKEGVRDLLDFLDAAHGPKHMEASGCLTGVAGGMRAEYCIAYSRISLATLIQDGSNNLAPPDRC